MAWSREGARRSPRVLRSARFKITRMVASTVVLSLSLGSAAVVSLVVQHDRITDLTVTLEPAISANRQVLQSMTDAETGVRGYQLTAEGAFLAPLEEGRQPLRNGLDLLDSLGPDAGLGDLPRQQRVVVDRWFTDFADPVSHATTPVVSRSAQDSAKAAFDQFRTVNNQISTSLAVRNAALIRKSNFTTGWVVVTVGLLSIVCAGLILVRGRRALLAICPPLEDLHHAVTANRHGDGTARADPSAGVAEIRDVAAAVNDLVVITQLQQARLVETLRMAEAVREVGRVTAGSLDLEAVIDRSVEPLARHFDSATAWIRVFEGDLDLPGRSVRAGFPPSPTLVPSEALLAGPIRASQAAWVRHSVCVVTAGERVDPQMISPAEAEAVLEFLRPTGVHSLLFAGIGTGQHCTGYIALSRVAGQPAWTTAEHDAVIRIGHDIGQAILNARLFGREQQLVEQAVELDSRKNDFVSTVSHELRTPLAAIIGHLELLRSEDLGEVNEDQHLSLTAIDRNSERLTLLIGDLLLLSRIEEGAQPARLKPVDLDVVVADTVKLHDPLASAQQLTIRYRPPTTAPVVLGEASELDRVVSNLLSNAIKFSPAGADIVVALTVSATTAFISVSDRGLGISADDQKQLFTKFFRSTNPIAQAVPGTGLGLTISKLIVEKHRGTMDVQSTMGEGTTFAVTLPLHTATSPTRHHDQDKVPQSPQSHR